jgi:hypothetical protein
MRARLTRFAALGDNTNHDCASQRPPDGAPRSALHLVPRSNEETPGRRQPVRPLHLSEMRLSAHDQTRTQTGHTQALTAPLFRVLLIENLEHPAYQPPDLFHPFAIDAKVSVTGPGRRTEMQRLGRVVEDKLHVVHEPEQETGELVMQVGLIFFDEGDARQRTDRLLQSLFRLSPRLPVANGVNGMALIGGLCRHTVRTGWTGGEGTCAHRVRTLPL